MPGAAKYLFRNEQGMVLIVGLLVTLVLSILAVAAMMTTGTELKIAANDCSAKEAFYAAEAGTEDARSRLQPTSSYPITDNHPTNVNWVAFVGTEQKSQSKGYQNTNSNHARFDRLNPPNLDYVVTITHKLDGASNILKWGDANSDGKPEENTTTGSSIYVITADGSTSSGAAKVVRIECARMAPVNAPAALYTKANTTIQGSSTYVTGLDGCGGSNLPGIVTQGTVNTNGGPTITGSPSGYIQNSPTNMDLQYLVNQFKAKAGYSYDISSEALSGMNWGVPTPGASQQSPSSCSAHNIVYVNTHSTYVQITGASTGCGILLVEGDLSVHGGFQWYGIILVTGSITFTGGGGKNITGAVLAGGMVSADLVGGDANIIYCSQAVNSQTDDLPLVTLRWIEVFG